MSTDMISCPECGCPYSASSQACPECGMPNPTLSAGPVVQGNTLECACCGAPCDEQNPCEWCGGTVKNVVTPPVAPPVQPAPSYAPAPGAPVGGPYPPVGNPNGQPAASYAPVPHPSAGGSYPPAGNPYGQPAAPYAPAGAPPAQEQDNLSILGYEFKRVADERNPYPYVICHVSVSGYELIQLQDDRSPEGITLMLVGVLGMVLTNFQSYPEMPSFYMIKNGMYARSFGKDSDAAAKMADDILQKVYGVTTERVSCNFEYGQINYGYNGNGGYPR